MRRKLVYLGLVLLVVGGCWAANSRSASDLPDSSGDPLMVAGEDDPAEEPTSGAPELDPPLPMADGEYFEAYDLLRNRPLAHRSAANKMGKSIWIDGSGPDFVRYVQGNHRSDWLLHTEVLDGYGDDEQSVISAVRGRDGELTMPAFVETEESVMQARVFNPARHHNSLEIRLNGTSVETVKLEEGWQIIEIDLAEAPLRPENTIVLNFSNLGRINGTLSGGGISWLRLGPAMSSEPVEEENKAVALPDDSSADDESKEDQEPHVGATELVDRGEVAGEEESDEPETTNEKIEAHSLTDGQGPMTLDRHNGLAWTVWVHDDALLDLEIEARAGCGIEVALAVESGDGAIETVVSEDRRLVVGRGDTQTTVVDLGVDEGQLGRLDLHMTDGEECENVKLTRARLVRPGIIDGIPDDFERPKYVIFWVIDTLRADYLPLHFETDVQAPNLQRLADEGVSFETAYVQGTESRASHASLFTGQYPDLHGVMSGGRVDPNLPIIPNFFQDEGYSTALLAANGYVSHLLNLNRGWDHYRNYIHEEVGLSALRIKNDGVDWIETLAEEDSFFLYMGSIEPHATYRRHTDFIGLYEPDDYRGRFQRFLSGIDLGEIKQGRMQVTDREKERIINLYKNEITYNDHIFGKLREALEEKGIWDDTLIVVTSDHGEEFWEHGSVGHGHNVHQEMVHVPLLFHYPRSLPAGRTVRSGGEVVDILPTIMAMLGQEPLEDRQGMNLLPTIFGEHGGYPAPVLATQYMLEYGIQARHWKLYLRSGNMRLYDRSVDPGEDSNVIDDHPLASRWLQDSVGLFRHHRQDWDKSRWGTLNNVSADFLELSK